jgi:hypothetical protein
LKEPHIILRVTGAGSRGSELRGPGTLATTSLAGPADMSVEIESLDSSELHRVARHRDVVCVAPSMPMTLIQPAPHVAGVAALWAQKLKAMGPLNPGLLSTRVVGSGITTGLAPGFDPADIGSGMVTAPQN